MANVRDLALQTLISILSDHAYSNRALNGQIEKNKLTDQERNFLTELVYGTLQHYELLLFYARPYFKGRVKTWITSLIAMTLYQILYLDRVPEHAAISEAVNIARTRGGEFNKNLVNAILREIRRNPLRDLKTIEDARLRLAIKTSHPLWLINLWWKQYGEERTKQMAVANNERPLVAIRVNTTKTTREELRKTLENEGIQCEDGRLSPDALIILKGNSLKTAAFKKGLFYIQDEASMLVARILDPQPHGKILDACSAPGGKATHVAQLLKQTGTVYAHDLYEHKIKLIEDNAQRLGLTNIVISLQDAKKLDQCYQAESFDGILVDAPCSGLGILRRHPEAKITKKPEDLDAVTTIGRQILTTVAPLVKKGGAIVYSTCTVNLKENDKQVEQFLKDYPQFSLDKTFHHRLPEALRNQEKPGMLQLFPGELRTDGFFIARLIKRENA